MNLDETVKVTFETATSSDDVQAPPPQRDDTEGQEQVEEHVSEGSFEKPLSSKDESKSLDDVQVREEESKHKEGEQAAQSELNGQ